MIRVGITGGAGYTAGELIRLLVNHPQASIAFVNSASSAGKALCEVHEGLIGETRARFTDSLPLDGIDVLFLCGAHGSSSVFLAGNPLPAGLKVIDLAQDHRDGSGGFVYGLPESNRAVLKGASKVANPGCFATALQLGLLPLAAEGLLESDIQVTAVTGSTGAGAIPSGTSHFSWRNSNISSYKVFRHQHLQETVANLSAVAGHPVPEIYFVPVRGDYTRGIFASINVDSSLDTAALSELYEAYYADAPFTFVSGRDVDLKQVVNTNKCVLHVESLKGKAVITAVIDNLLKGASGQAVQNMNLICGLDETAGLRLKASAF